MDYEKRYKEALERAKQVYKTPYTAHWDVMKELIEHLFPELKETDDEKIRTAILNHLKKMWGNSNDDVCGVHVEDVIAWLEKAVTPTPQDWNDYKEKPVELWNAYVKGLANGAERGKEVVKKYPHDYGLEKQGESKPTSWKPTKEQYEALDYAYNCCPDTELGNRFEGVLSNLIDELHKLENQKEQNSITDFSNLRTWKYIVDAVLTEKEGIGQYLDSPFTEELAKKLQKRFGNIKQIPTEWSEEDEAMFQGVIETEQYMLDVVYGRKIFAVGNEAIKEECTKELAWLKSLRPQKQWKSAWSEEDKEKIDFLIGLIWFQVKDDKYSFCYGDKVTQVTKGEAIDMLKSLKGRIK